MQKTDKLSVTPSQQDKALFYQLLLTKADEALMEILESGEKDFLFLGNHLKEFMNDISSIESEHLKISQNLINKNTALAIGEVDVVVDKVGQFFESHHSAILKSLEQFQSMIDSVYRLNKHSRVYYKLMEKYEKIWLLNRIEIARLHCEEGVFQDLVDNIEVLSKMADQKVDKIVQNAMRLKNEFIDRYKQIKSLHEEQAHLSNIIVNDLHQCLQDIQECYRQASIVTEQIGQKAKSVAVHVNELITSIQFHDIVRQKIEHCHDVLNGLISTTDDSEFTESEEIAHICALQIDHLNISKEQIVNAVEDIVKNLVEIGSDVYSMNQEAQRLDRSSSREHDLLLKTIGGKVDDINKGLFRHIENKKTLYEAACLIFSVISEIAESVWAIHDIEAEIEMVSLNLTINAAHMGERGATVWVLAESIKDLSKHTNSHVLILKEILQNIQKNAEAMRDGFAKKNTKDMMEQEVRNIADVLKTTLISLNMMDEEISSQMKENQLSISHLEREIQNTISNISVHTFFENHLEKTITNLSEIIVTLKKQNEPCVTPANLEKIDALKEKYTMKAERDVHRSFMSLIPSTSGIKTISKFATEPDEIRYEDNVEFF